MAIDGWKVGATEVGLAIGGEECREGPSALAADSRDCSLVAGVDVGPLVAVYLDGDEVLVDDLRGFGVFVAFAVHDVAPVTPDGTNI